MTRDVLRVGMDMSILQHPQTGSARWATGLLDALRSDSSVDVVAWPGLRRLRRGALLRKVANLVGDEYWYRVDLPRRARAARIDVLLMPVNLTVPPGPTPQVVTILDVNFLTRPGTYDAAYTRYATRAFRRSAQVADGITTVSAFSRAEIARHLDVRPERIRVIHPGLTPPPARPPGQAKPLDGQYALYVGATEPHKNVGLLLEAWAASSPANLQLAVVGHPGRDHDRLAALAERMNGRVVIVGGVDAEELEAWYMGASVFLFPSTAEGFGYPPLEAMQRRVPVIAARAGALPEVLKDGAIFHDPHDADELRAHIERVMDSSGERKALIERGLGVAAEYTWHAAASAMVGALREVTR